jgi:heat shock protein HslJ
MVEETEAKKAEDKKRKNILLIIAVIVLGVCGVYYLYTNKNINTADSTPNAVVSKAPADSYSKLTSKKWTWKESQMSNDITTTPSSKEAFTATFQPDGALVLTTDCNSGNSSYKVGENNSLTIQPIASTMMFCEGSAETAYFKQIQTAGSYKIENNQLWIILQMDTGTMIFE